MRFSDWRLSTKLMSIISGGSLIIAAIIGVEMWTLKQANVEAAGLKAARAMTQQVKSIRAFYTNEIIPRIKKNGLTANFDFKQHDNVFPLPATLVYVMGEQIEQSSPGTRIRLYSNYPFPNRASEQQYDDFERDALNRLKKNPKAPIWRLEEIKGRLSIRYITADIMKAACVTCHNAHPDSPKRDWKVGDVRGGLEITIPVDDVADTMLTGTLELLASTLVGLIVISGGIIWFMRRNIVRPIDEIKASAARLAGGDLTAQVNYQSADELGALSRSFNTMRDRLKDMIVQITSATGRLAAAAEQLSAITGATNQGMERQRNESNMMATAVTEMSSTAQEVARTAENTAQSARQASERSQHGKRLMADTVDSIHSLAGEVSRASEVIAELGENSQSIGVVLDVIRGIAEQTNLLALNAAIEAARAGEHGRGFSVVADEVRTLASRTQHSTAEIQAMIAKLQAGAEGAVKAMEQGRTKADLSVQKAAVANDALDTIASAVTAISDLNNQVASAAEEQSAVADEIGKNVVNINDVTDRTSRSMHEIAQASAEMSALAARLQELVGQFRH